MNGAYRLCEHKDCKCMTCRRNNSELNGHGDCYPCRECYGHNHKDKCKKYVEMQEYEY